VGSGVLFASTLAFMLTNSVDDCRNISRHVFIGAVGTSIVNVMSSLAVRLVAQWRGWTNC
jgi:hypothetical protein